MIIGVAPDIQENYVNVKRLWLECGIDKLSRQYTIATDLKRLWLECGIDKLSRQYTIATDLKRLWLECGIDKLSRQYTIATDLKLCNILLGLMSHSSAMESYIPGEETGFSR